MAKKDDMIYVRVAASVKQAAMSEAEAQDTTLSEQLHALTVKMARKWERRKR